MSSEISQEELQNLQQIANTDPEFVTDYLSLFDKENGLSVEKATMPQVLDSRYYTVKESAEILGVCQNTVLSLIKNGKIKASQDNSRYRKWLIGESDFQAYCKETGFELQNEQPQEEKMEYVYAKHSSKNIVDFLSSWPKSNLHSFSTLTLTREFNAICRINVTEQQMSGTLSTLAKKGVVERLGRGIYRFVKDTIAEVAEPVAVIPAIPKIEQEEHQEEPSQQFKKEARLALDDYLDRHSTDDEDFHFSIDSVAAEYPKISRVEIGKAIQNLHTYSKNSPNPKIKIEKAEGMGNYYKPATIAKKAPIGQGDKELLDKLLEVVVAHAKSKNL